MNSNLPHHELPDLDVDLENDALWSLLQDASPSEASPRFVQDTLRRVRLEEDSLKASWWHSLLSPKILIGTAGVAGAALAAIAIFTSLPSTPITPEKITITEATQPAEDWNELEHAIASELLSGVAEDPSLLSDQEIVALLF